MGMLFWKDTWITQLTYFSNIGVLQTTVAELVTVKEHQRRLNLKRSDENWANRSSSPSLYYHAHGVVHWVSHTYSCSH